MSCLPSQMSSVSARPCRGTGSTTDTLHQLAQCFSANSCKPHNTGTQTRRKPTITCMPSPAHRQATSTQRLKMPKRQPSSQLGILLHRAARPPAPAQLQQLLTQCTSVVSPDTQTCAYTSCCHTIQAAHSIHPGTKRCTVQPHGSPQLHQTLQLRQSLQLQHQPLQLPQQAPWLRVPPSNPL